MKRLFDGILFGSSFALVVAVLFEMAYAADILTIDKDGAICASPSARGIRPRRWRAISGTTRRARRRN